MSRERARRREARLAATAERDAGAERRRERDRTVAGRRARFAALAARLPGRGRARPLGPRRPGRQRAVIAGAVLAIQVVTWNLSDSWPLRIAVAALTVLAVPALTTLTFDRSSNR
jgi:hypothetical protein